MADAPSLWIPLVIAALVSGACFVAVLAARRGAEPIMALLGLAAFGLGNYALVLIVTDLARLDAVLYGLALLIGGTVGGWVLGAALLDRSVKAPRLPSLDSLPPESGRAAVVVLSCVEPTDYDPREVANMLTALTEEDLISPSLGTLPFLFFAQKARYRAVGGRSPARAELTALAERIESRLGSGQVGSVAVATCTGSERLAVKVAAALEQGHRRVIVAQITVGESLQLAEAKREVDALRLDERGATVTYTSPLGDAESLVDELARRALSGVTEPGELGVVLVGHGQPEPLARRNPEFDAAENAFLNRIRMRLVDAGVEEANARIAWAEWGTPDVTSVVRHLAALGCRRVSVMPAVFPFTSIGTLLDLEISVREARVDEAVGVLTMAAWRDSDALVDEVARRVEACLGS